jgi:5-hydroxyisourate hydrolase-like protein (transthyretin family)
VLVRCYDDGGFFLVDCDATTDADGTYALGGNLPSDVYTVRFSDPVGAYAAEWYDDAFYGDEAQPITVTVGTTVAAIDAALTPAGAIAGTVTDSDGDPFPLTTVAAFVQDGDEWRFFKGVSAEYQQPDYRLDGLPAGTYRIKFRGAFLSGSGLEEFYNDKPTLESADNVTVTVGQTTSGIDAVLGVVQPGGIAGTVTDAAGTPLGGVVVTLFDDAGFSRAEALTQPDGGYLFDDLYDGAYVVRFAEVNGAYLTEFYDDAATFDAATPIPVGDALVSGIDAALAQPGTISGNVLDLAGDPLDFLRVTAYRQLAGAWEPVDIVFGDPAGDYVLTGLQPDTYRLEFMGYRLVPGQTPTMYVEFWDDAPDVAQATDVVVADGATLFGIDATLGNLTPNGLIGGLVLDQTGARATDANVTVYWHNGEGWTLFGRTTTNSSGIYRLRTLADGSYAICFGMGNDGYARRCYSTNATPMPTAIELHDGQNRRRIDMTLTRE